MKLDVLGACFSGAGLEVGVLIWGFTSFDPEPEAGGFEFFLTVACHARGGVYDKIVFQPLLFFVCFFVLFFLFLFFLSLFCF